MTDCVAVAYVLVSGVCFQRIFYEHLCISELVISTCILLLLYYSYCVMLFGSSVAMIGEFLGRICYFVA